MTPAGVNNIEIYRRGIMHDVGVMFAGENITRAAHIRSQLINLVKELVENVPAKPLIAQVSGNELIGFGFRKVRPFEINTANPETFVSQPRDKVAADEPTRAQHNSL